VPVVADTVQPYQHPKEALKGLILHVLSPFILLSMLTMSLLVTNMLNKLHGQPDTYDKKYVPLLNNCAASADNYRSKYKFGRTLGAGTYGIVREAEGPDKKKVAIKIILKKNVKGNEQMVVDELRMLREMKHPHIVQFVDWFESRVRCIISRQ
jgi:calcium/calmodulin-dependent protein kinase I